MLGTIRSLEQITFDELGDSSREAREKITAKIPPGFELISAMSGRSKAGEQVSVHGIARSTETRELEAGDLAGLRAATPEGWQLITIRTS